MDSCVNQSACVWIAQCLAWNVYYDLGLERMHAKWIELV